MSNVILDKSKSFANRIIKLNKYLREAHKEFVISKQILRSGTSIAANVREAHASRSDNEFVSKMSIALQEAAETELWLELLHSNKYLTDKEFKSIYPECNEINKILISIVKKMNEKIKNINIKNMKSKRK